MYQVINVIRVKFYKTVMVSQLAHQVIISNLLLVARGTVSTCDITIIVRHHLRTAALYMNR